MAESRRFEIDPSRLRGGVAVLLGGNSAEREVSLNGGGAVHRALQARLPEARAIDAGDDVLDLLRAQGIAHVFLMLHGPRGEDGTIQGALDLVGISYTGSGVAASALAMDKLRCKWLWRGMQIDSPGFAMLEEHSHYETLARHLGEQMIVKPSREGSSVGMARISNAAELRAAWESAHEFDAEVLVESWIDGAEYTVSIVDEEVLPSIRLETDREFYDYEAKYISSDTRYLCPCGLADEAEQTLRALALRAYRSVGCTGWGRVDLMRDSQGKFQVLEVNTCPGMTDHSLVPMAAKAAGFDFENLVARIFASSLEKN